MLSVVIVSFNTRELTRNCLRSLRERCAGAEVIVVDNASHDGSADMIRAEFPEVKLITLAVNRGFAGGNNPGLEIATGDFVILLNSDTVIEDDALDRCIEFLNQNPKLGATSPQLIGADDKPQRCYYRFPSVSTRMGHFLGRDVPFDPADGEPGWIAGTALLIRRDAFDQVGRRLDDHFFMYWEDCDMSARLNEAGWQVAPHPRATIRHHGGASGGGPDAARRPDLFAWYTYGEHRWFAKHKPFWQTAVVSLLDLIDVARKFLRGLVRPARRPTEWAHAKKLLEVLAGRLIGRSPRRPG